MQILQVGVTSLGNAATVVTNANLTGEITSIGNATTVTNAAVIGKVLTGYTSGAGTVTAADNILEAIQKLNGNNVSYPYAINSIGTNGQVLAADSTEITGLKWVAAGGTGTVTSVAVSGSDGIEVDSGSPITEAGTIALGVNKHYVINIKCRRWCRS